MKNAVDVVRILDEPELTGNIPQKVCLNCIL